jgi:hypothetical protein
MKVLHRVGKWIGELRAMSTENLNLLLAAVTVVLAIPAVVVAIQTLGYMRGRDLEVDNRSGWIEVHRAMVNLEVQREFVLQQRSQMGAYSSDLPNRYTEHLREFLEAYAQLRGQLDRLNDDPLGDEIARFLEANRSDDQWQSKEYEVAFGEFARKAAMKSRPK